MNFTSIMMMSLIFRFNADRSFTKILLIMVQFSRNNLNETRFFGSRKSITGLAY